MGAQYIYRIVAEDNFFTDLEELTIEMTSTFGDADIRVTIDGLEFSSSSQLEFDQIRLCLNQDGVLFGTDIYIYISAKKQSHYQLLLFPIYKPTVDKRLAKAVPMVERKPH